jgi:hypothetical protein
VKELLWKQERDLPMVTLWISSRSEARNLPFHLVISILAAHLCLPKANRAEAWIWTSERHQRSSASLLFNLRQGFAVTMSLLEAPRDSWLNLPIWGNSSLYCSQTCLQVLISPLIRDANLAFPSTFQRNMLLPLLF